MDTEDISAVSVELEEWNDIEQTPAGAKIFQAERGGSLMRIYAFYPAQIPLIGPGGQQQQWAMGAKQPA